MTPASARMAVKNAIAKGTLQRPEGCSACGKPPWTGKLHAHHDDYDKPLDVRWLCASCHKKQHGNGRLGRTVRPTVDEDELRAALRRTNYVVPEAAIILRISKATVYRLMDRYGVTQRPPRQYAPLTVEKVAAALTLANGNVSEAARMLGVSRVTIYKWKARINKERAA